MREERRLRVFREEDNKEIFELKRDEVTGEWRKLHNEELNDLYSSPNIIRVIKSKRIRGTANVARMRKKRGAYRFFWWRNLRDRDHLKDPSVDGRIILR
jgi:hypothetical protein